MLQNMLMLFPEGGGHKFGWALVQLSRECLPRGAELTSQWEEGTFPRERKEPLNEEKVGFPRKIGLPLGVEGASRQ
jgi:hypothetical protein